ncbi:MAG: hypothetical protein F8N36_13640 [Desulfovibrio sp.]|uniref:hypothetical protein n=1 Tax=Desulfovibrio sp. TaxID=885 RepID=UPI00135E8513|nr:hypothetical protein [Desulfovibrio sp.]MTJ93882.1 hypothetical protein [Desulfovibrio sp.]
MGGLFPQALPLRKIERDALEEFKAAVDAGRPWGRKRIVSMQACEEAGYVKRVTKNGLIADWELTEAGKAWTPPADL